MDIAHPPLALYSRSSTPAAPKQDASTAEAVDKPAHQRGVKKQVIGTQSQDFLDGFP
jgi:hypothetical protein